MRKPFADRMAHVHRSFVSEILQVTENQQTISFAGGIPNSRLFPVREIADAAASVMAESAETALQYTTTQGYPPLRQWIAERYWKTDGLRVEPEEIVITNGSQQALDLIGKVFLNKGDRLAIEKPGYHGAIHALCLYEPAFLPVPLLEDGIDLPELSRVFAEAPTKLFYAVPNFQNPSSRTYSLQKRTGVASLLAGHDAILVEDDPYGELRFGGDRLPPIKQFLQENTVLLGTFSKSVVPGLRIGWACARREIAEMLTEAKQAADFHSDFLAQRILHRYLTDNDLDAHLETLRVAYRKQRDQMLELLARYLPPEVRYSEPEGGMFVWVTLPERISTLELFELAAGENVAFVPGRAFHLDGSGDNTMRLSFSTLEGDRMEEGMKRLGRVIRRALGERGR